MNEKKIREIVRDEIRIALAKQSTALSTDVSRQAAESVGAPVKKSRLAIDEMVDALEAEEYAPVMSSIQMRADMGMSAGLAIVMGKMERGFDLTPLDFSYGTNGSYFVNEKFKATYIEKFKAVAEMTEYRAYKETCAEFGLLDHAKADPRSRVLAELPATAGGGFRLTRGEAEAALGVDRQLEADTSVEEGVDDEPKVKRGGIFE